LTEVFASFSNVTIVSAALLSYAYRKFNAGRIARKNSFAIAWWGVIRMESVHIRRSRTIFVVTLLGYGDGLGRLATLRTITR
jgi:hypothetical protein